MGLKIRCNKEKCHVRFDGELTIYKVAEYRQKLLDACKMDKDVEVDLSAIDEIDTGGLQLLAALGRAVNDAGNSMVCVQPSAVTADVFELCRFYDVMQCVLDDGSPI